MFVNQIINDNEFVKHPLAFFLSFLLLISLPIQSNTPLINQVANDFVNHPMATLQLSETIKIKARYYMFSCYLYIKT